MKYVFLFFIKIYGYFITPFIGSNCRFYPTCSIYAEKAILKYSIFFALFLIIKRILRCNSFFKGGYDPLDKNS